jgi:hypothetical protein
VRARPKTPLRARPKRLWSIIERPGGRAMRPVRFAPQSTTTVPVRAGAPPSARRRAREAEDQRNETGPFDVYARAIGG